MLIVAYFMVCVLVAVSGRNRRIGFVGTLFLSLLITPILSFLILWMTGPVSARTVARRRAPAVPTPP